jgi:hypothetical protein
MTARNSSKTLPLYWIGMLPISVKRALQILHILGSLTVGWTGFLFLSVLFSAPLPFPVPLMMVFSLGLVATILVSIRALSRKETAGLSQGAVAISALIAAGSLLVMIAAYQLVAYIRLPVDLLSFSESSFVDDIIKLRLGMPIYTNLLDNNSYPYNPGTQILTYVISSVLGHADSIPFYRAVQFSYVVLASVVAMSATDLLAQKLLSKKEYRHRPLLMLAWLPFLFLVSIDSQFNIYNHSLHNDGLALLVSISAFWLIVRHSNTPRPWLIVLMAALPAAGFLVKQNQLMWLGIFAVYMIVSGTVSRREFLLYLAGSIGLLAVIIGSLYLLWGDNYIFWTFQALGDKQVSLPRSVLHLFQAGIYAMMGLLGGWILVLRNGSRMSAALWLSWFVVFAITTYTSGLGFTSNHMGPAVVIAASWFFVALVRLWPSADERQSWWQYRGQEAAAVAMVVLLFGGVLGFMRELRNPVTPDFYRYVADIEQEFQGHEPSKVLMDTGSWIYLKSNVLMKDRSAPVSLHVGSNQPEISYDMLASTIQRFENKTYDKILARELDSSETWYDFQDRGSGVRDAILENYYGVRRIPAVEGIDTWWPRHLVAEIIVLEPKQSESPDTPNTLQSRSR